MDFSGRSLTNMSGEMYDVTCTACEKANKFVKAVSYCVECFAYCCQSCTDLHKQYPLLIDHNLLDSSEGNKISRLPEFPTERCSKHKGKVLDQYCRTDDHVGCSSCIADDHRYCPDNQVYSIPDMLNSLFNLSESKQIQGHLRSMMAAMTTLSHTVHIQLETLNEAQDKALEDITTFQNALVAILKKAAETSRQAVKDIFKKLENRLLQHKQDIDNANAVLLDTENKMNEAEANRAQHFSCTKEAKRRIRDVEIEKMKQEVIGKTDIHLSFIPDRSLWSVMEGFRLLGEVNYAYRIKDSRDMNVRVYDDSSKCGFIGCCQTNDNTILAIDALNKKLKRIDIQNMNVDYCTIDGNPLDVCRISDQEVALTCGVYKMIQFVSIDKKMKCTRQIKTSHGCCGITAKNENLYVTDSLSSLNVHDMAGNMLRTISRDDAGRSLFSRNRYVTFNKSGSKMYVTDKDKGVLCFDGGGHYLTTFNDEELKGAGGVCVDGKGNVLVSGTDSHNVLQFNADGKKIGVIVKQQDGLQNPRSLCFLQSLNKLVVTMKDSGVIKVYELE